MGFVDSSNVPALPVFYNVVHAVGVDCPNHHDDVMLVQYLLKSYYDKLSPAVRPKGTMKIDGACGPITLNWIQKYQLDCNKANGGVVVIVDGRMDRVRNRNLIGSMTGKLYSLAMLNYNTMGINSPAWASTPYVIPMLYTMEVPPPGNDYVPPFQTVPTTGGA